MTTIRSVAWAARAATRAVAVVAMFVAGTGAVRAESVASPVAAPIPSDFTQIAETPTLRLHVNSIDSRFIVEDRRSGKQWSSNPLEALGPQKASQEDALFLLSVTNAKRQMTNLLTWNSEKPQVAVAPLPAGFRATYDVGKFKMKIAVEYLLKEDRAADGHVVPYLEVTVPDAGIEEYGDCSIITSVTCFRIVTLEVLPLFGAARVGQKGYVMVPDGAGAIVEFKSEYPQYRQRYSAQIYGPDAAANFFTAGGGGRRTGAAITRPTMPLWGVKHEDGAYAGIVTQGEFQANINAYLAGYIMSANRGSAEFIYRRQASIPRRRSVFVNKIEEDRLPGDRQVRYVLLSGDDANYAGMARAYRDFLMMVKGVKPVNEPVRPLLDLFMGITRQSSFREDFVPTTTFEQALTIIRQFVDKGVKDFDVHLLGWGDDGYRGRWPRRYPADSELGGNDGLKSLIASAKQLGVRVILEDDYMFGYTFSSGGIIGQIPGLRNIWPNWSYGFNSRWDTVRGVNKLPVFEGSGGIYLLNPVIARDNYLERDLPTHKAMGAYGVNLRQMGTMVMSDTNDRYPLSRQEVAETWMKMADRVKEVLNGGVIVSGPNAYVIGRTDRVYDAPVSSLDAFGDVTVPVYHIATQGLVVRHTIRANLRNDPKTELLRQYEWGMQPVYQLTAAPSSDLIRTDYNLLYSSQVDDWLEPATQEYKFMRETFGFLENQMISNHEMLSRGFNRVTYADGTRLYVNYNPEARKTPDGAEVRAYGYALERKGSGR